MKVAVEFDVVRDTDNGGVYLIEGAQYFGTSRVTRKIIEAFEAAQPQVFERDGYTITKEKSTWNITRTGTPMSDGLSIDTSVEAWKWISTYASRPEMRQYIKSAATLAEFLEERGL